MIPIENSHPPKWMLQLFHWFCHPDYVEDIEGDLLERYGRYVQKSGKTAANWQFFKEIILLFRPNLLKPIHFFPLLIPNLMFRNNLKIAWRNLFKNKSFSFINIGSLSLGMLVFLLISLWIHNEISYNTQYKNADRIAQIHQNQTFNGKVETWRNQAMQLEPALRKDYGNNFKHIITGSWVYSQLLSYNDKKITKNGAYFGEEITEMLELNMLQGTRAGLQELNSILLAASTAKALFGDTDPMNKTVQINNDLEVAIKGVYEDLSKNSVFGRITFLMPFKLRVKEQNLVERTGWGNSWFSTYVQVEDNISMAQASAAIKDVKYNNIKPENAETRKPELFLHPMKKWYLYGDFKNGVNVGGRIEYIRLFGIIALFVLALACINFMNLSTARSEKRAKEVGIRKTLGSLRSQIMGQFFSESILIAFFAFLLALIFAQLSLSTFNEITNEELSIPYNQPYFWLIGLGFVLLTGFLAGSYPAFYLSSFRPLKVLKGTFKIGQAATLPRKVLVVIQFTVSISLIIGTIFVFQQIQHAKNRPIGYNRDNLIRVPIKSKDVIKHFDALRSDLLNTGQIIEMAGTDSPVSSTGVTNGGFDWAGRDPNSSNNFTSLRVTYEFGEMVDWNILEGRDFSREFGSDKDAIILNEAAVAYMGLENPVGTVMTRGEMKHKIVGVVKNLVTQSPYNPIRQTLFMLHDTWIYYINIKLKPETDVRKTLSQIETIFKKYDPVNDFDYQFENESYARKFRAEERIGKLASFFALFAVFISCLGLFGLASYLAEQRTKEIGIRKVLGASVLNLWQLLSKEFIVLVFISCLFAIPIAYYFTDGWLQGFAYRTGISWWVFALVGLFALLIALITVSFQAIKAALMNPVHSIKSE
jgi:ABC-type antimicrobial peptide transport system permease subunit